jgi:hypothetical protein
MKRRVHPLMARDTLGYEYTGEDDMSWMPSGEIDDDDIVERLGRIFKDMPPYMPCPVPEYSAAHLLSHLFFQRKPSANLYACQDQFSCI